MSYIPRYECQSNCDISQQGKIYFIPDQRVCVQLSNVNICL